MKLKYLLPVATIASVATVVTPLVTSCGSGATCTWTKGKEYKPMTPKAKQTFKTNDELTVAYQKDVVANRKIYSDDMVNFYYGYATDDPEEFGVNKVSYNTTKVGDIKEFNSNKYFRIDVQITLDAKLDVFNHMFVAEYKNRKATVKNMPMILNYVAGGNPRVDIEQHIKLFGEDNEWSVDMPEIVMGTSYATIKDTNKTYNLALLDKLEGPIKDAVVNIIMYLVRCQGSNYYKNAVVDPE